MMNVIVGIGTSVDGRDTPKTGFIRFLDRIPLFGIHVQLPPLPLLQLGLTEACLGDIDRVELALVAQSFLDRTWRRVNRSL